MNKDLQINDFLNDKYKVLNFLFSKQEYINGKIIVKGSQEELSEKLGMTRYLVSNALHELIELGYILNYDQKGKYTITEKAYNNLEYINAPEVNKKVSQYKCGSFFAGIGGIELGFKNAGFETIYANEYDKNCAITYNLNFDTPIDLQDIHQITKEIDDGNDPFNGKKFQIIMGGFPCQAFSIAGYREGFEDKKGRGGLFFELMKIIRFMQPEIVFLENVKNLTTHDHGKTFKIICDALESENYHIKSKVLNSMEYGNVPQNRERIYIVAFKNKKKCDNFHFPFPQKLTKNLHDVIDYENLCDSNLYYTSEKFIHYDLIKDIITKEDTVYQWRRVYVRENKNNVCPTLTANMGTGGHNVPLVFTKFGIRKLTPRECFNLQGFPASFILPEKTANCHLYKQAGNSVSVSVIEAIAKEIIKVL